MRLIHKLPIILLFLFIIFDLSFAINENSFRGRVNANNINIRSDSTVSSEVVCKVNKGYNLEIIAELYDWYKVRLPKTAPAFIKKNLVVFADVEEKTAKAVKDNINIRLRADETSAIIGRVTKGESVNILQDKGEWYKIEPANNSFGWIHKNFIDKATALKEMPQVELIKKGKEESKLVAESSSEAKENITVEGIIKPKVMKRIATHKLIHESGAVFLLRSDKENLNAFNNRRVRVVGKIINPDKQGSPIMQITKIEAQE